MRLLDFTSSGVYVHSTTGAAQSGAGGNRGRHRHPASVTIPQFAPTRPEVMVTTEQITMSEFPSDTDSPYVVKTSHSPITSKAAEAVDDHKSFRESDSSDSAVV
ncbi:hypothetical protein GYMLUDRAFT_70588 [Collybiopsis luxurians FD-317 M1]|nr:hypothetical protein GYMLUDRAFT_70588 [Collybiopsis luxurians FD-317 M1]